MNKELLSKIFQSAEEEQRAINRGILRFRKGLPNVAGKFMELWRASKGGDAIPLKYKELMQLAIVLVQHCKPCIFLHTKACVEAGATKEEILETAGVALAMGGGPVYEYIGYLLIALEEINKSKTGGK